ncbi:Sec-independent protein translocase protein TatB [Hydrogenophaga sp.]|uniref:Sec-independent protein translocase protein TatB n=1 Tax=Hydrogenophaga sp. TaxID=1904254 RepID=UPI0019A88D35|nr:Sec-independent protein translocase protein TatB [Hydrogenophaga sp.]MBD3892430.1 Sec-independent protein translocase subunit TatB [Hydrogenophaga sp.]
MLDFGVSELAVIGAVALLVIGPEKLPRVARTVGALLGKAQRYVADVKAEVSRSIDLEELKKMKESMEGAAREVEDSVHSSTHEFEKSWSDVTAGLDAAATPGSAPSDGIGFDAMPAYKRPKKNWRIKQKAIPQWYKMRNGVRTHTQSGAARVARFRPRPTSTPR